MHHLPSTTIFAATESAEQTDILSSLGIDWTLLALQAVAFLLLVVVLAKFVYPVFLRIIDEREKKIEESTRAAADAEKQAEKAQASIEKSLKQAREEATAIVATAKDEATAMISAAEEKSKTQAERIVAAAHESIEKDVIAAKKALHNETIELVAQATEKVVAGGLGKSVDKKIIESAVKEVE